MDLYFVNCFLLLLDFYSLAPFMVQQVSIRNMTTAMLPAFLGELPYKTGSLKEGWGGGA